MEQMLIDSYERGTTEPITIIEYDDTHVIAYNNNTNGEYLVEINNDDMLVTDCTCPHWVYRLSNNEINKSVPCKHIIAVAMYLNYNW